MDTVRIGIIGIGGMGRHHAKYLSKGEVPGAQLTAVADINPKALENVAKDLGEGVATFDSGEAMMKSGLVDAVMIATPHYFHPPLAIEALKNGLHALVEKPAGVYTKQVREMNEFAAQSDKILGIMFNQRTRSVHQKMKEMVASGELGEIKRTKYVITDWFRTQSYYDSGGWRATWGGEGGGVLVNQSPHNLDLWQWICGMPVRVRAVCGFGRYHNIEVEDDVTAVVEYANGATGVFIVATGEAPGENTFEIAGDRGRLLLEGGKLKFWKTAVPVSQFLKEAKGGFDKPPTELIEIDAPGGDEHKGITTNWVNAILNGTPLLARGDEGINGVQLANAMLLSAWTDGWVEIPVDEDLYWEKLQEKIATSTHKKEVKGDGPMEVTGTF